MQYNFEWDPVKARKNAEKHGVTLSGQRVFSKTQWH